MEKMLRPQAIKFIEELFLTLGGDMNKFQKILRIEADEIYFESSERGYEFIFKNKTHKIELCFTDCGAIEFNEEKIS